MAEPWVPEPLPETRVSEPVSRKCACGYPATADRPLLGFKTCSNCGRALYEEALYEEDTPEGCSDAG